MHFGKQHAGLFSSESVYDLYLVFNELLDRYYYSIFAYPVPLREFAVSLILLGRLYAVIQ